VPIDLRASTTPEQDLPARIAADEQFVGAGVECGTILI